VSEKQEGQCRCGAVRFTAEGPPLITMACHCRGCQRMSASAFSLSSLYDRGRFEVSQGEPVLGGLKGATRHFFCSSCMSWLFTRPEGMDEFVNVRSTMFENPEAHRPFVETYYREALPGVETGAVERFDTLPEEDQFGPLIGAYAQWGGTGATIEKERA
jgi:hypothetical protein